MKTAWLVLAALGLATTAPAATLVGTFTVQDWFLSSAPAPGTSATISLGYLDQKFTASVADLFQGESFTIADVGKTLSRTPASPDFASFVGRMTNGIANPFYTYFETMPGSSISQPVLLESQVLAGPGSPSKNRIDLAGFNPSEIDFTLESLTLGEPAGGYYAYGFSAKISVYAPSPVPEPTAVAFLAVAAGGFLACRRGRMIRSAG